MTILDAVMIGVGGTGAVVVLFLVLRELARCPRHPGCEVIDDDGTVIGEIWRTSTFGILSHRWWAFKVLATVGPGRLTETVGRGDASSFGDAYEAVRRAHGLPVHSLISRHVFSRQEREWPA